MKKKLYKQPCPSTSFLPCILKLQITQHTHTHTHTTPHHTTFICQSYLPGSKHRQTYLLILKFSNPELWMISRLKMQDLLQDAHTNCYMFVPQIPEHLGNP